MDFCEKCGTRLVLNYKKNGKGSFLICNKCGDKKRYDSSSNKSMIVEKEKEEQIIVIGKKEQKLKTLPTATIECPKCENNQAYTWQIQTRGADESSTQFFRCTKCNHTFREYS